MQAPDHLAGKRQNCPMCGKPLTVPDPNVAQQKPVAGQSVGSIIEEELQSQSKAQQQAAETQLVVQEGFTTIDVKAKRKQLGEGFAPSRPVTIIVVAIFGNLFSFAISPLFVLAAYAFFGGETPSARIVSIIAGAAVWFVGVYCTLPALLMGRRDLYEMHDSRMHDSGRPGVIIGMTIGFIGLMVQLVIGTILAAWILMVEFNRGF